MKRIVLATVIISLATAPLAFADGPIMASAKQAAVELAKAGQATRSEAAPSVAATAASAAAVQGDSGMSVRTKTLLALGFAAAMVVGISVLDSKSEDATPASLRERRDLGGCPIWGCP
jgi:hypothetical protein